MKAHNSYHIPEFGDVTAIGKTWVHLPQALRLKLHIMVYADTGPRAEAGFTGICLELGLFSWASTIEKAQHDLKSMCVDYTQLGAATIYGLLSRQDMEGFWALYRQIQFLVGDPEDAIHADHHAKLAQTNRELETLQENHRELQEDMMMLRVQLDELNKRYAELSPQ